MAVNKIPCACVSVVADKTMWFRQIVRVCSVYVPTCSLTGGGSEEELTVEFLARLRRGRCRSSADDDRGPHTHTERHTRTRRRRADDWKQPRRSKHSTDLRSAGRSVDNQPGHRARLTAVLAPRHLPLMAGPSARPPGDRVGREALCNSNISTGRPAPVVLQISHGYPTALLGIRPATGQRVKPFRPPFFHCGINIIAE